MNDELIRKTAEEVFGIKALRTLQQEIIATVLNNFGTGGSSLLAVLPTG